MERWKLIFVSFLIPLLLIVFLGIYLASKFWETYCKIRYQMEPTNFYARKGKSKDRGFVPAFNNVNELPRDLSQMYYYHDNIWHYRLPRKVLFKKTLKDNGECAPANVVAFSPEQGRLFVVFRSTKTNFEITQNLRICQKKIKRFGYVHRGISRMYGEMRGELIEFLENSAQEFDEIIIFGHSLGGAFVNVLSVDLMTEFPEVWSRTRAFASASPKILDPKTVKDFELSPESSRLLQVINEADLVTHQPLCATTDCNKIYYYKSFSKNTIIFNRVVRGRPMDSHVSSLYSKTLWNPSESCNLRIDLN